MSIHVKGALWIPVCFGLLLASATPLWAVETRISADHLRGLQLRQVPALTVVDVRGPGEFLKGHIQGARNIPSAEISKAEIERTARIVVYCGEDPCPITSGETKRLKADGYSDVSILAGGLPAWEKAGYPVVRGGASAAGVLAPAGRETRRDIQVELWKGGAGGYAGGEGVCGRAFAWGGLNGLNGLNGHNGLTDSTTTNEQLTWSEGTLVPDNLPLELTAAWRNAVLGATLSYLDGRRSSAAR